MSKPSQCFVCDVEFRRGETVQVHPDTGGHAHTRCWSQAPAPREGTCSIPECPNHPARRVDLFCQEHWRKLPADVRGRLYLARVEHQRINNPKPYLEQVIAAMLILEPPKPSGPPPSWRERFGKWVGKLSGGDAVKV